MRRSILAVLIVAAVALTGWLTWRWWSAPASEPAARLAAVAAGAPTSAEGVVVVAEPRRVARWVIGHPQALGLIAVAAPQTTATLSSLRPVLQALVGAAKGPLALWWRGPDVALAATVGGGARSGIERLAALRGLSFAARGDEVRVATAAALVENGPGLTPPPPPARRIAVLASARGRWWIGTIRPGALLLESGDAPQPPPAAPTSSLRSADLAAVAGPLGAPREPFHGAACLALSAQRGWALALPAASLPEALRAVMGGRTATPGPASGTERWDGALGELIVLPHAGLTVASDATMLASVVPCAAPPEEASLRGTDLAWAAARLGAAMRHTWIFAPQGEQLADAAPLLASLGRACWRLTREGGVIELEW